jgi:hypothetical protein
VADVVAVVRGHPLPLILRPRFELLLTVFKNENGNVKLGQKWYKVTSKETSDETPDEYAFIGDAYVDGIMHGEAVEEHSRLEPLGSEGNGEQAVNDDAGGYSTKVGRFFKVR